MFWCLLTYFSLLHFFLFWKCHISLVLEGDDTVQCVDSLRPLKKQYYKLLCSLYSLVSNDNTCNIIIRTLTLSSEDEEYVHHHGTLHSNPWFWRDPDCWPHCFILWWSWVNWNGMMERSSSPQDCWGAERWGERDLSEDSPRRTPQSSNASN